MKFAKFMMAAAVAAGTLFAVTGCGDSQIKQVKNGSLDLDKSRSVDTALNSKCSSVKWKKYKNNAGQTVILAEAVWKDPQLKNALESDQALKNDYLLEKRILGAKFQDPFIFPGDKVNVYFIIKTDNAFEVANIEVFNDKGAAKWTPENTNDVSDMMKIIYQGPQIIQKARQETKAAAINKVKNKVIYLFGNSRKFETVFNSCCRGVSWDAGKNNLGQQTVTANGSWYGLANIGKKRNRLIKTADSVTVVFILKPDGSISIQEAAVKDGIYKNRKAISSLEVMEIILSN